MTNRKYSDPTIWDISIDWDDNPDGSDGGYDSYGNYINAEAMMELVSLRQEAERLKAELLSTTLARDTLADEIERLKEELQFAAEALESWGEYASPYFRTKHNLDADLERVKRAAE